MMAIDFGIRLSNCLRGIKLFVNVPEISNVSLKWSAGRERSTLQPLQGKLKLQLDA